MASTEPTPSLNDDLGRIEASILPTLTLMLDALLDAAALARPGHDAACYAAEIRTVATELENVTRQIERLSRPGAAAQRASAA
jgi:hypothetical protein